VHYAVYVFKHWATYARSIRGELVTMTIDAYAVTNTISTDYHENKLGGVVESLENEVGPLDFLLIVFLPLLLLLPPLLLLLLPPLPPLLLLMEKQAWRECWEW
jgi:hypothetical protein